MLRACARYVGAFFGTFFLAFWVELLVRTGEFTNPVELVLGWSLFLGGIFWFPVLLTSAPLLLLVLSKVPEGSESVGREVVRRAIWGAPLGLLAFGFWGVLLGRPEMVVPFLRIAPVATVVALAVSAVALGRTGPLRSPKRVAYMLGGLAAVGLVYRVVIPAFAPAFAYEQFDDSVANTIAARVLSGIRRGDSVAVLARRLPGFVADGALQGEDVTQSGVLGSGFDYFILYRQGLVDSIAIRGSLTE